jgi:NAD(P)-dependent dehydrogenase (short-subunit alcohol dehydrogenase family)
MCLAHLRFESFTRGATLKRQESDALKIGKIDLLALNAGIGTYPRVWELSPTSIIQVRLLEPRLEGQRTMRILSKSGFEMKKC